MINRSYLDKTHNISSILTIWAVFFAFFVIWEPAPSDYIAAAAIITGLPFMIHSFKAIPLSLFLAIAAFLFVNLISAFWHGQSLFEAAFMVITLYLVVFFFNIVGSWSSPQKSWAPKTHSNWLNSILHAAPFESPFGRWIFLSFILSSVMNAAAIWAGLTKGMMGETSNVTWLTLWYRPKGFFQDPNVAASYLIFPIIWLASVTLAYGSSTSRRSRGFSWLVYLFLLSSLFYCSSRASVLAWAAAYLLVMFYSKTNVRKKLKHFLVTGCFILLIVPLPYMVNSDPFDTGSRVLPHIPAYRYIVKGAGADVAKPKMTSPVITSSDTGGRIYAWMAAWEIFRDNPIIGSGPGSFEKLSPAIERKMGVKELTPSTHNTYLRILAENGSLGFLSFVGAVFATLMLCVKKGIPKQAPWILAAFIGIMINAFFIDALHWRHLWIIWALLILLCNQNRLQTF